MIGKNTCLLLLLNMLICLQSAHAQTPVQKYAAVQNTLQMGWGTYNHKSVLSHVLLPYGLALNIGIKITDQDANNYLRECFISSRNPRPETVVPGDHAMDGSYTALTVTWQNVKFSVESAVSSAGDIVLLVTPLSLGKRTPNVVLETGMMWNKKGIVQRSGNMINATVGSKKITVRTLGDFVEEYVAANTPYIAVKLNKPVAFYTGATKTMADVNNIIRTQKSKLEQSYRQYGAHANTFRAMQNVLAWNIIYDAAQKRVIYPVSRLWNDNFGGQSVLFCWDTYFSAYMAGMLNKNLAYANAVEITKSITPGGFIPNWSGSYGKGSFDRSQPPVGSLVFKELYRKYKEKWLLEYVFNDLLTWNRWWPKNRDNNGLLCWGSNKVAPPLKGDFAANAWQGAAYESGLDNSPMYDNVPFDTANNMLALADVGLMGLYIADCAALAEIAGILNKPAVYKELKKREEKYRINMQQLWNEKEGIYMNKRTDTKAFSPRLSPTNFYPLIAKVPNKIQAERMVKEHLLNPKEFNGEWMLPSVSINDPAFKDQEYWRGRIWAPMNFLVYLGLLNYDLPEAKKILADKSEKLLMDNVNINGWIFENYNGITGNVTNQEEGRKFGDNYYHWGALLGFIALIENGFVANPMQPVN